MEKIIEYRVNKIKIKTIAFLSPLELCFLNYEQYCQFNFSNGQNLHKIH